MTVEELKNTIVEANRSYRIGTPVMTDGEYDSLVDNLKKSINSDDFYAFRRTLTEDGGDVSHKYIMGSLDKIKAFDDDFSIKEWIYEHVVDSGDETAGIFVSSKIDGCSGCLVYSDGKLVSAATRGNGTVGKDITRKAKLFAPDNIGNFSGVIRGEITLTKETMSELIDYTGTDYKNIRNTTAGLIGKKNVSDTEIAFLRFFAYEIMGDNGMTKSEQYRKLKSLGFNTALHKECTDIYSSDFVNHGTFDDAMLYIYNEFETVAPFDMDGLVVSDINDTEVFENEFIPERTVAVKFNQKSKKTMLIDVIWDVSKSGRLSPVGVVESVNIGGSEVTNVTLNNLDYMRNMGLKYGCTVEILKSGDVIPKIVGVEHPNPSIETEIVYPSVCPKCGSDLEYEEGALFPMCPNRECDGILINKMVFFLTKLGIKHVKYNTLRDMGVLRIKNLLELQPVGGKLQKNLVRDLENKMFSVDRETLLMAFDFGGVSSLIISKMLDFYGYDKLITASYDELVKSMPYGVGEKFIDKFTSAFSEIKDDYLMIMNDGRYTGHKAERKKSQAVVDGVLGGKAFVVTGALNGMSRKEFENMVVRNGGVFQTSVCKKTNYLVTNDTKLTTKMRKAKEMGVTIINESQFMGMLPTESTVSIF